MNPVISSVVAKGKGAACLIWDFKDVIFKIFPAIGSKNKRRPKPEFYNEKTYQLKKSTFKKRLLFDDQ